MHQFALADRGAGLHARNISGTLLQRQPRHPRRDCTRSHNKVLVRCEVELIDHAAQQVDVNLPAGSGEAGADFDDHSHIRMDSGPGSQSASLPRNSGSENPATPEWTDNISILPLEWLSWQGDKSFPITL